MARNNPKPLEKLDWIPDDTTNILEPLPSVKATGWLFGQKPPNNSFNFITNLINRLLDYAMGQAEDWIVIDSDADEGDYATLVAYIADAPAAGDRILVKEDQTVTAQLVLPNDVTLKFLDGLRLLCATNIATSVLKLGSNPIIEGVLNIVLTHTSTTAKAIEYDGDNVTGKINIENASTGTLTTGHHINANKTGNSVEGFANNTGGGVLTNIGVDNSTEDSNRVEIVDEANNQIWRSRGAYKFREGMEFDLSSDADGDIYYRDAGILKRLAKGTDGDILKLTSGLPSWTTSDGNYTPTSTSLSNIASVDSLDAYFIRTGDTVIVYFRITVTPTAGAGADTDLTISLPIAADIEIINLYGSGTVEDDVVGISTFYESARVEGDVSNDGADINFKAQNTNRHLIVGSFSYRL